MFRGQNWAQLILLLLFALCLFTQFNLSGTANAATNFVTIARDANDGQRSLATQGGEKLIEDQFGKFIAVYVDVLGRISITYANGDPTKSAAWSSSVKSPPTEMPYYRAAAILVSSGSLRIISEGGSSTGHIHDMNVIIFRAANGDIQGLSFVSRTTLDDSGTARYPTAIIADNGDLFVAWNTIDSISSRVKALRWSSEQGWSNLNKDSTAPDNVIIDTTNLEFIFPTIVQRRDNHNLYLFGNRWKSSPETALVFAKAQFIDGDCYFLLTLLPKSAMIGVIDTTISH